MIKSICKCYYDEDLYKQSTNCPLHDPYRRCEKLEAHIDQLESEIAELRKDRERLDWLERNQCGVWVCDRTEYRSANGEFTHEPERRTAFVGWVISDFDDLSIEQRKTPREAIDAAIAAAGEKENK